MDNASRGGHSKLYQMDTGLRLTLPKAGAFEFGENTISKNEGSLGEKPNFGSKLGENVTFDLSRFLKKKSSKMAKMINLSCSEN